jgi:hypothetical protein
MGRHVGARETGSLVAGTNAIMNKSLEHFVRSRAEMTELCGSLEKELNDCR